MKRTVSLFAMIAFLSACSGDGTNPFDEPLDPNDPSSENSKFLFNVDDKLTMNQVDYDEVNDKLVINNLPFDGPDGIYDRTRNQGAAGVFKSRQTVTTGTVQHYAVFMKNADFEVSAAAGADWIDTGYGGANVKRTSYNLPGGVGEYIYVGSYAGVRTRDDGPGLQIVTGDTTLRLDIKDFDENGTGDGTGILEGAIVGVISNKVRTDAATGALITNQLPRVSLAVVQYDPETGSFDDGLTVTGFNGGVRDTGGWEGFIGGSSGSSIGGYVTLEGPAETQLVTYEVITWVDPVTGQTGVELGFNNDDYDTIYNQVDAGQEVPLLQADRSGIPAGANISVEIEDAVFRTSAGAREIGVILTEQIPTQ